MGSPPFRDPTVAATALERTVACPFHDGPQTVDLLLAELRTDCIELLDLALELRTSMTARTDAADGLQLLFQLRHRLGGRHHLAFYRVRCWVRRLIVAEVRPDRGSPWLRSPLPLDCARYDELRNRCLATLAGTDGRWPFCAQFRVRFLDRDEADTGAGGSDR